MSGGDGWGAAVPVHAATSMGWLSKPYLKCIVLHPLACRVTGSGNKHWAIKWWEQIDVKVVVKTAMGFVCTKQALMWKATWVGM